MENFPLCCIFKWSLVRNVDKESAEEKDGKEFVVSKADSACERDQRS